MSIFVVEDPPEPRRLLLDAADGNPDLAVIDACAPSRGVRHFPELLPGIQNDLDLAIGIEGQGAAHLGVSVLEDSEDDPARLDLLPAFIFSEKMARNIAAEILFRPMLFPDAFEPLAKARCRGVQRHGRLPV